MAEAPNEPRKLDVVLYSELTDTIPQPRRVAWEQLANDLTEHDVRTEKDGPGWSATVYRKASTRGKAGVEEVTALVLDVDHDEPQWSLLDGLEYRPWLSNRQKASQPRRGRIWCWGCDRQIVPLGQKCSRCGSRATPKRRKHRRRT